MSARRYLIPLVGAAALALPASAGASFIVYDCPDSANLCRVDPGTGAQTQLTQDGQPGTSTVYGGPSLSRDGTKLAFVFHNQVFVGDANAANRTGPFPNATTAFLALMRPDGGAVAEIEETFSTIPFQVCTYSPDGGGRDCPYGTSSAGWAPDNNLLISVSAGAPNYNLEICHEPDQAHPPCASDPSNNLYDPAVSPDGLTLAVTVASGTAVKGHIALYNYTTGQFERDLTSGTGDEHPTWSPDGTQIAFQRGTSIYVIGVNDPAGSEHQLVAQGAEPTWGGSSTGPGPGPGPAPGPGGVAPNTRLFGDKISRSRHKATFKFSASGSSSGFQCALVKVRKHQKRPQYSSCHSPKTYKGLARGKYEFFVRAVSVAGADPSPATHKFSI